MMLIRNIGISNKCLNLKGLARVEIAFVFLLNMFLYFLFIYIVGLNILLKAYKLLRYLNCMCVCIVCVFVF